MSVNLNTTLPHHSSVSLAAPSATVNASDDPRRDEDIRQINAHIAYIENSERNLRQRQQALANEAAERRRAIQQRQQAFEADQAARESRHQQVQQAMGAWQTAFTRQDLQSCERHLSELRRLTQAREESPSSSSAIASSSIASDADSIAIDPAIDVDALNREAATIRRQMEEIANSRRSWEPVTAEMRNRMQGLVDRSTTIYRQLQRVLQVQQNGLQRQDEQNQQAHARRLAEVERVRSRQEAQNAAIDNADRRQIDAIHNGIAAQMAEDYRQLAANSHPHSSENQNQTFCSWLCEAIANFFRTIFCGVVA